MKGTRSIIEKFKDSENLGTLIVSLILILMTAVYFAQSRSIERNKVYVLGYLKRKSFEGSEMGWMYDFEYYYDSLRYSCSFGGPLKESVSKDSLMLIMISKKKPHVSRPVEQRVPGCLKAALIPRFGWDSIPSCK